MDMRRSLAIARKWAILVVACTVLAAAAAFAVSSLQHKTYQAATKLIVGQSLSSVSPDYAQLLASQQLSTTYATIATTRPILQSVITQLGLDTTPDELAKRVSTDASSSSTLLSITAEDASPDRAAAIANAVAQNLITTASSIQGRQQDILASIDNDLAATQQQISATQDQVSALLAIDPRTTAQDAQLATLEGRLVTLRSTYATLLSYSTGAATNLLSVVEPAAAPADPISPRPLLNTVVAALLGLLIAIGLVVLIELVTDGVRSTEDAERASGLSVLGTIGRHRGAQGKSAIYQLTPLLFPQSGITEGYRTLRANLEFTTVDMPLRSILITSAQAREGKTMTAANLALVFAQAGRRVLLVDADLRKPRVHEAFSLANGRGLTTWLLNPGTHIDVGQRTDELNLTVLTTGPVPPNPAEVLGSQRMRSFIETTTAAYDLVIIDSPPLLACADAAILAAQTDGTVLVIDASVSRRRAVRAGREMLDRAGARVLGAVLNRVAGPAFTDYGDAYGSYFGREASAAGTAEPQGRAAS